MHFSCQNASLAKIAEKKKTSCSNVEKIAKRNQKVMENDKVLFFFKKNIALDW